MTKNDNLDGNSDIENSEKANISFEMLSNYKKVIIEKVRDRHIKASSFGNGQWENFHGLERCDCEQLLKWLEENI